MSDTAEIERLQAEVARLTDERKRGTAALRAAFGEELWRLGHPAFVVVHLRDEIEKVARLWKASETERAALLARAEAAEKDAARYRWLADVVCNFDPHKQAVSAHEFYGPIAYGPSVDAAIDAAMEGRS